MDINKISNEDALKLFKNWRENPEVFSKDVLGGGQPWEKQLEIMRSVRDNRRTTVRSGHGIGKSYISARIVLWFLQCWKNSIVVTTAPTQNQVEKILWGEIRNQFKNSLIPLSGECLYSQIKVADKHYAIGLSTDKGDRIQGFNAEHVLIVVDEASGVADEIYESIEGLMARSHCRLLLIGNPLNIDGEFYKSFKDPSYNKIHVSCLDSPNVRAGKDIIPGLTSKDWVDEKKRQWGEDSSRFKSRILGEFPEEGEDTLIPLRWVERAERTFIDLHGFEPRILAIDVARFGTNDTVFLPRIGDKVVLIDNIIPCHQGKDLTYTTGRAIEIIRAFKPDVVVVDDTGVGGGLSDNLSDMYEDLVFAFNGASEALDKTTYINLKAEEYYCLKEKFRKGIIDIPKDTRLSAELPEIKTGFSNKDRIKIENKRKIGSAKFESPDFADALMMSEWGLKQIIDREPNIRTTYIGHGIETDTDSRRVEPSRTGYG